VPGDVENLITEGQNSERRQQPGEDRQHMQY